MSAMKFAKFDVGKTFNPFPTYNLQTLHVREMVIRHMEGMLKSMQKKLKGRHSFQCKRNGEVEQLMNPKLMWEVYRVFRDLESKAGLVVKAKWYKGKKKLKMVEISFFDKGRFVALMDLFGVDVVEFLKRTVKGDRRAEVLFEEGKTLTFNSFLVLVRLRFCFIIKLWINLVWCYEFVP